MMLGRLRGEGHRVEAGPDQPAPLGTTPRQGPFGEHELGRCAQHTCTFLAVASIPIVGSLWDTEAVT